MKALWGCLVLVCFALMPVSAFAADAGAAPSRDSLVRYWEEKLLNDPEVRQFEKTSEKGVYKFHTTFFPYKGRLKLLNAAITKSSDGYYSGLYSGIIEVELLDAEEDFIRKYSASYGAWMQQNYFYYSSKTAKWFPTADWAEHSAEFTPDTAASKKGCPLAFWGRYGDMVVYLGVIIAVLGGVIAFARKQNQRVWDSHEKALAAQKRSMEMVEESLKNQREQIDVLKQVLAALRKK